jgi:hypothetical protein
MSLDTASEYERVVAELTQALLRRIEVAAQRVHVARQAVHLIGSASRLIRSLARLVGHVARRGIDQFIESVGIAFDGSPHDVRIDLRLACRSFRSAGPRGPGGPSLRTAAEIATAMPIERSDATITATIKVRRVTPVGGNA